MELLARIWGENTSNGSRVVDMHISRIRAKIGDINGTYIKTIRGKGYIINSEGIKSDPPTPNPIKLGTFQNPSSRQDQVFGLGIKNTDICRMSKQDISIQFFTST